jgi:vitamin B12/bleomycin/antimicrobial peptide transport system ATP-binding/permease protein
MTTANKFSAIKAQAAKVWALSLPYFNSERKWKARGMLALIVLLNLGTVYMSVLINDWNRDFYNALQEKNQPVFWQQLWRFTYLAFSFVILAVYKFYITQLIEMRWREWMTTHMMQRWLHNKAFYTMELMRFHASAQTSPDNPDQRIQEDVNLFTSYTVSLSMGLLNSVVTLISFVGVLWGLSGMTSFKLGDTTYEIAGFMVWAALLYAVVGSVVTHYMGKPQIGLNFKQQQLEADFRHHLVRVREHSEAIALDSGEAVERKALDMRFASVITNYFKLLTKQKHLVWFTSGYGQAAVIFPILVAAPRYFGGSLQFGQIMQIMSAFNYVQGALSWFIDNYPNLAIWKATTDRLTSFEASLLASNRLLAQTESARAAINSVAPNEALHTSDLSLQLPGGQSLAAQLNLSLRAGDAVWVQGPSGSGKSTLLRSFAGIWPFARGRVQRADDFAAQAMFVPQRPYLPQGSLRAALAYPQDAAQFSNAQLHDALDQALLPALKHRLNDEDAWDQKLSGGEQQRLALARVFLKKPRWVFADEATSALDEAAEKTIYERLLALVKSAQGAIISIAHRSQVAAHHQTRWQFEPQTAPTASDVPAAKFSMKVNHL